MAAGRLSILDRSAVIYDLSDADRFELQTLQEKLKCAISGESYCNPVVTLCCGAICNEQEVKNMAVRQENCRCCSKKYIGNQSVRFVTNFFNLMEIDKKLDLVTFLQMLTAEKAEKIQDEFTCPVSQQVFLHPVFSDSCSHGYEIEAMTRYCAKKINTVCPACKMEVKLLGIPLIENVIQVLNRLIVPLNENLYISRTLIEAMKSPLSVADKALLHMFEQCPKLFNEALGNEGDLPPAFYFANKPYGRSLLKERSMLRKALNQHGVNLNSYLNDSEGESVAYWLCVDMYLNEENSLLADNEIRDLINADSLGHQSERVNPGAPALHIIMRCHAGLQWFKSDAKFRAKINKITLNKIPTNGVYKSLSPLLIMCHDLDLRKVIFGDKVLSNNVGSALNVSYDDTGDFNHLRGLSPLLLITTKFTEEGSFDFIDLLHQPAIRAEITEYGFHKKSNHQVNLGISPALNLLFNNRTGLYLLAQYPDLRDKYSAEFFNEVIEFNSPLKGASVLLACMVHDGTFRLFDRYMSFRCKLTLEGLLHVCDVKDSRFYGESPLSVILSRGTAGWEFLIKLFKDNTAFQNAITSKFNLPNDLVKESDLSIAIYLYRSLMRFDELLASQDSELVILHLLKLKKHVSESIIEFAIHLVDKPAMPFQFTEKLIRLIHSEPGLLNLTFKHTSFLQLYLETVPGMRFIKECVSSEPTLLDGISSIAWNEISQHESRRGSTAFMRLCISAIGTKSYKIFHSKILNKIKSDTLFVASDVFSLNELSALRLLLINSPHELLFQSEELMAKVTYADLVSHTLSLQSENMDYINYLLATDHGRIYFQRRLSNDYQFHFDYMRDLNSKNLNFIKNCEISLRLSPALQSMQKSNVEFWREFAANRNSRVNHITKPLDDKAMRDLLLPLIAKDPRLARLARMANDLTKDALLDRLLFVDQEGVSNLILLFGVESGWGFLIQLLRHNTQFRSEFLTKMGLPDVSLDESDLIVVLQIYTCLLSYIDQELISANADMNNYYLLLKSHLFVATERYTLFMMRENAAIDTLFPILKKIPHLLNFTSNGYSFLQILLARESGYNFIVNNPQIWANITVSAWNAFPTTGNLNGITAFLLFCFHATGDKSGTLDLPGILEKIDISTLLRRSQDKANLFNSSVIHLLILNHPERFLINNKMLREMITLEILLSYQVEVGTSGSSERVSMSLFDFCRQLPSGRAFIQVQLDGDVNFRQAVFSCIEFLSLLAIQKGGVALVQLKDKKFADTIRRLRAGLYGQVGERESQGEQIDMSRKDELPKLMRRNSH